MGQRPHRLPRLGLHDARSRPSPASGPRASASGELAAASSASASASTPEAAVSVLGSWVGVRRPFRLSLFLTAPRMVLPQDPIICGLGRCQDVGVSDLLKRSRRPRLLQEAARPFPDTPHPTARAPLNTSRPNCVRF